MQAARGEPEVLLEGERLFGHRHRRLEVTTDEPSVGRDGQHQRDQRMFVVAELGEGGLGPREQLVAHPAECELVRTGDEPQRGVGVALHGRPTMGHAQVVEGVVEEIDPSPLVGTAELGARRGGQLDEVRGMPSLQVVAHVLAGEVLTAERPQRLEERVPGGRRGRVGNDHRLVDERRQDGSRVGRADGDVGADSLDVVEGERSREHRQAAEHRLLGRVEQVVRPLDGGEQCLVARFGASPRGEQREALVETGRDIGQCHGSDPGCRQLDGERNAVEAPADLDDRRHGRRREAKSGLRGDRPVDEQPDAGRPHRADRVGLARVRHGERTHEVHLFTVHRQRLAAGGEDAHARAHPQDGLGHLADGSEQVLAVVEHDQQVTTLEHFDKAFECRTALVTLHIERRRDRIRSQCRLADGRQIAQPHAIGVTADTDLGEAQCQPRLPHSTRSDQREEARALQHRGELGHVVLAPDERRQRQRKCQLRVRDRQARIRRRAVGPDACRRGIRRVE